MLVRQPIHLALVFVSAVAANACTPQPSGQDPVEPPSTQATSTTAQPTPTSTTPTPGGQGCASGAPVSCPEGQVDGCLNGTSTEHRCVDSGPGRCVDIRAALVKCEAGETLTHDGCMGEEYVKRCAK